MFLGLAAVPALIQFIGNSYSLISCYTPKLYSVHVPKLIGNWFCTLSESEENGVSIRNMLS